MIDGDATFLLECCQLLSQKVFEYEPTNYDVLLHLQSLLVVGVS
jgi:hypothetical protein